VLRYDGAPKSEAPTVLVGKGITFDTGGISIKPAPEMDEMKFDMCGAASVLGVFRALAELKPAINVVGLIPACENMPDGRAVKPGDVVTSMSGQTIEILNTDAEGRLVLCDALTYAERFKPVPCRHRHADRRLRDRAGRCAQWHVCQRRRAGRPSCRPRRAGAQDLCWRMPLDDEYAEGSRPTSPTWPMWRRAGGRDHGGQVPAALSEKFPWAHLDIAGTAWKGGAAKGATGRPVGLLLPTCWTQARQRWRHYAGRGLAIQRHDLAAKE
jgi:leucyl aminopeptidase